MLVRPDAKIPGRNAASRFNRARFGHDQTGPTHGATPKVREMPIVRKAVLTRVLAHRRDHDAVRDLNSADVKRREQMWLNMRAIRCARDRSFECTHTFSIAARVRISAFTRRHHGSRKM